MILLTLNVVVMQLNKCIFFGGLDFGNERTFRQAIKMYHHKLDTMYQTSHFPFDETFFNEDTLSFSLDLIVSQTSQKNWKNAGGLIEFLSAYAISGKIRMWFFEDKKVTYEKTIEPNNEKSVVQSFINAVKKEEKGDLKEAAFCLDSAIEKYEKHALAYERRGFINVKLKNIEKAKYDFNKSIKLYPKSAGPYYGLAKLAASDKKYEEAIELYQNAIKYSIPLLAIHWSARRRKGYCLYKLGRFKEAAFEYKFFTMRNFSKDNYNHQFVEQAWFQYGKILLELKDFGGALAALDKANILNADAKSSSPDILLYRGIAKKEAGKTGFKKDWSMAAKNGSKKASILLETM